jgi:hypothetical protein
MRGWQQEDDWFQYSWLYAGLDRLPWPVRAAAYADAVKRESRPAVLRHLVLAWAALSSSWLEQARLSAALRAELLSHAQLLRATGESFRLRLQGANELYSAQPGQETPAALLDKLLRRLSAEL